MSKSLIINSHSSDNINKIGFKNSGVVRNVLSLRSYDLENKLKKNVDLMTVCISPGKMMEPSI